MTEHPTNLLYFSGNLADLAAQVAKSGGLVVADFGAAWCPPCERLASQLPLVAQEAPLVTFLQIDVDHCRELASHYGITTIPQLRFLKCDPGGEMRELGVVTGVDVPQLRAKIRQLA
jgi:thiol-disulfide isomerase/thioredoxin